MTTTYTLFGQPSLAQSGGSAACVGTQFQAAVSVNVTTIWFFSMDAATVLPDAVYIYTFGGGTQVFSATPTWSGVVGSGWVSYTLPVAHELTAGDYVVTASFASVQSVVEFARTNPTSGPLSGTEGGYNLTVGSSYPSAFLTSTFLGPDIGVQYLPLAISTGSLPNSFWGVPYSQTLEVTGGTGVYTWSLQSGSLPSGLTLSSGGVISGTPTGNGSRTVQFTVEVTDTSSATDTQPLSVTTNSLSGGITGWDLYSTLQQQAAYYDYYRSIPPVACPNDGEPLQQGPPEQAGVLWCRFDGWQYPRDFDADTMNGV